MASMPATAACAAAPTTVATASAAASAAVPYQAAVSAHQANVQSHSHSHSHSLAAPATTLLPLSSPDISPRSSPSTTPAKRAGSDAERVAKRRSPPYPPGNSDRTTASPTTDALTLPASTSPSGSSPSANLHATSLSHGQAVFHSASFQMPHRPSHPHPHPNPHSHSHSHSNSLSSSRSPHSHYANPNTLEPRRMSMGAVAAEESFGDLVEASDLSAPHQTRRRPHSLTSGANRQRNSLGDFRETTSQTSPTTLALTEQQTQIPMRPGDVRSDPVPRAHATLPRSPAFPRGLDEDAVYSDLSVLGFPMPLARPDRRAPERLADSIDEWGLLSELGPVSRRELFSVGGGEHRVPNDEQAQEPDPQEAQEESETLEPDAPVTPLPRAEPTRAPEVAQAGPELARSQRQTIDQGMRTLEQQLLQFQQHGFLQQREIETWMHRAVASRSAVATAAATAGASSAASRPNRPPFGSTTGGASEALGATGENAARIAEMRRLMRQMRADNANTPHPNRDRVQGMPARNLGNLLRETIAMPIAPRAPAAPETPVTPVAQAMPAAAPRHPPDFRTSVPQQERNNAVRDWRNGVAQHIPAPVPEVDWDTRPDPRSIQNTALASLRERLRERHAARTEFTPIDVSTMERSEAISAVIDGLRGRSLRAPDRDLLGSNLASLLNEERGRENPPGNPALPASPTIYAAPEPPRPTPSVDGLRPLYLASSARPAASSAAVSGTAARAQERPPASPTHSSRPRFGTDPRVWRENIPVDTINNFDPSATHDPFGTPRRSHLTDYEMAVRARRAWRELGQGREADVAGAPSTLEPFHTLRRTHLTDYGMTSGRARLTRERERERDQEREPDVAGAPPRARPLALARNPPFRAAWGGDDLGRPYSPTAGPSGMPGYAGYDRSLTIPPSSTSSARATHGEQVPVDERQPAHPERDTAMLSADEVDRLPHHMMMPFSQPFDEVLLARRDMVREAEARRVIQAAEAQNSAAQVREAIARLSTSVNAPPADGGDPVDLSDPLARYARRNGHSTPRTEGNLAPATEIERLQRMQLAAHLSRQRALAARSALRNATAHASTNSAVGAALAASFSAANATHGVLPSGGDDDERMLPLVLSRMTRYPGSAVPMTLDSLLIGGGGGRAKLKLNSEMQAAERTKVLVAVARGLFLLPLQQRRNLTQSVLSKGRWDAARVEGEKDECCAICQDDYIPEAGVSVTPCNHMYHTSCLESWIKTPAASTCPMCRRDLAVYAVATNICPEGVATARSIWMDTPADALTVREAM